jgi:hypothetical protein
MAGAPWRLLSGLLAPNDISAAHVHVRLRFCLAAGAAVLQIGVKSEPEDDGDTWIVFDHRQIKLTDALGKTK